MAYSTILFDVDGTLCDPGKSMIECARYALSKFDIHETDDENLRRLIGPPLEHAFRDYYGFDEAQSEQAVTHFRDMMQREGVQLYEAYPGISELLKFISAQQPNVVVDKEEILSKALSELDITDMSTVVMIGDRRHDVEAAKAHSVDSVGVLWGYGNQEELENEGATYIAVNANELRQLLIG